MTSAEFQERLSARARLAGVSVDAELGSRLERYYRLLALWNRRINLTGLDLEDAAPDVVDRILVEPLAAARHVAPGTRSIIDIGSGGGSPAIPLALAVGTARLRMVESKTRKSVFLREAARAAGLDQAEVLTVRYEDALVRPDLQEAHDALSVRAVRIDPAEIGGLARFVRPGGHLLLFRGPGTHEVGEDLPAGLAPEGIHPLVEALASRLLVLRKPG